MTIADIQSRKQQAEKITVLTAYDYPTASVIDEAGVDVILVGDSLANVVLGLSSTRDVGMDEMIHHTRAVRRAVTKALLVGDMPFSAYQINPGDAVVNARRFCDAGCDAVKVEWFDQAEDVARSIVASGIPVMGHVGLTPQTVNVFKVQGKDPESATKILAQAKAFERAGCFAVVLECLPLDLAREITRSLSIPTIGIGAGPHCDGQVMVIHDLLGLTSGHHPKFVKAYLDLRAQMLRAVESFNKDVRQGNFPDDEHSYH